MTNTWYLYYTYDIPCDSYGNSEDVQLNNEPMRHYGSRQIPCTVTDPNAFVRDSLITELRIYGWDTVYGRVYLTDVDIIYANGVLYYKPAPASPTHYIRLSMGFVPPELMTYFETYISKISDNLMTYLSPLPSPWEYLSTTYDRATNSFNMWLYLPATAVLSMSPGALQDIYDFLSTWVPLLSGILLVLIASFGPYGVLLDIVMLFAGLAILAWDILDAKSNQLLAETKATNLTVQIEQNNKEDNARNAVEDTWNKSAKTASDCITRLQSHRDIHLAKLNGFIDQYAKYPGLVTELSKEKDTFTANANDIITGFQNIPTSACDTYFVRMNSEIGTSNTAINDSLGRYIKPGDTYSVACKGWTNQKDCEKGECFWYDSSCHKEEACWIPAPLGGCVLSARTGKIIAGTVALLGIIGVAYWVATRHPGEAKVIIAGARESAGKEAARAKAAYSTIRAPVPATARVTI